MQKTFYILQATCRPQAERRGFLRQRKLRRSRRGNAVVRALEGLFSRSKRRPVPVSGPRSTHASRLLAGNRFTDTPPLTGCAAPCTCPTPGAACPLQRRRHPAQRFKDRPALQYFWQNWHRGCPLHLENGPPTNARILHRCTSDTPPLAIIKCRKAILFGTWRRWHRCRRHRPFSMSDLPQQQQVRCAAPDVLRLLKALSSTRLAQTASFTNGGNASQLQSIVPTLPNTISTRTKPPRSR